jgi:EmrB/QacA subfamily drug resistance transporter
VSDTNGSGILDLPPRDRRLVTLGVLTGTALAALEATVVGAAMPTLVASLGGLQHYSWVFAAYLLTSTVTVPLFGKLSDLYGRRPLYLSGVALFLLGSGLSGAAQTMGQLVAFRALQGVGAGALIPVGMTILADIYSVEQRARVQALFSGVWGLASVVGPPVGGFITQQMTWRWVFYLNIPFGIAAATFILSLREPRRERHPRIDYTGAVLLTSAMVAGLLGLAEAHTLQTLLTPWRLMLFGAAVTCAAAFVWAERRAPEPIVPPALMRHRVVAVSVICGLLTGATMFGLISFVPLYAQAALGASAAEAGATLTPVMLGWVTFSVIGGRLLLRVGIRPTVLVGQSVLAAGFVLLSTLDGASARAWLYVDLVIVGCGLGLTMLTFLIAVQQAVPRTQLGIATSVNQLARSLGGAVGVAIMGVILTAGVSMRVPGDHDLRALVRSDGRAAPMNAEHAALRAALVESIRTIFRLSAALVGVAVVVAAAGLPRIGKAQSEACTAETGERMMAAELTTLDAEHEPSAVRDR